MVVRRLRPRLSAEQQALVASVLPTATRLARQLARRRRVDEDEVLSVMMEEAAGCVGTYDPTRGTFEAYAWVWMLRAGRAHAKQQERYAAMFSVRADPAMEELSMDLVDRADPFTVTDEETHAGLHADVGLLAMAMGVAFLADEQLASAEQRQILREVLKALSERHRVVLDMRYLQDIPPEQVAAKLGVAGATERRWHADAMRRAEIAMRARGYEVGASS